MSLFSRTTTLKESGFYDQLTDHHSHILYGVDDGIKELSHSLTVLSYFEKLGLKQVWCTPHVYEDLPNETEKLKERFESLKEAYKGNIDLRLAAEYMLDNEFSERLDKNDLLPIGEGGDHLLVETSFFNAPSNLDSLLDDIMSKGYYPLLAHPERYIYMDKDQYKALKERGIKMQLNYTSIVGFYGKEVQEKAVWLLTNGMYNACGSDIHRARYATDEKPSIFNGKIKTKWQSQLLAIKSL